MSSLLRLQIHPETQSVSKQEPCPAAEICLFHLFSLIASNVWASAGLKNPAQLKAQPLRFAAPCCGDAGYIPLCLDFQVGESSGPSCSSPSLIIPVVIIPLNSRRLEGKKILIYQQPGSKKCKALPGKQPCGGMRGQTVVPVGPPAPSEDFRREVQSECSSSPAHPVLRGWELPHTPQNRWIGVTHRARRPAEPGREGWTLTSSNGGSNQVMPKISAAFS